MGNCHSRVRVKHEIKNQLHINIYVFIYLSQEQLEQIEIKSMWFACLGDEMSIVSQQKTNK